MQPKRSTTVTSLTCLGFLLAPAACTDGESEPSAESGQSALTQSPQALPTQPKAPTPQTPLAQLQSRVGGGPILALSNEILVKFKDTEPVGTVADLLLARGQALSSVASQTNLDRLHSKFGVTQMVRLSRQGVAAAPSGTISPAVAATLHQQRLQSATAAGADAGNLFRIRFSAPNADVKAVADEYAKDPTVAYAEPNYLRFSTYQPNDPLYSQQWAHQATKIASAWDASKGTSNVVIAVMDSGVAYTHPDLASKIWRSPAGMPGRDFVDLDTAALTAAGVLLDPNEDYTVQDDDPSDYLGHGTHCAGIAAAATNNGRGIAGVAIAPRIMPLRTGAYMGIPRNGTIEWTGASDTGAVIQAIDYAIANSASVISMSFGGPSYSQTELDAVNRALAAKLVVVAAAGNDNSDGVSYPAGLPGVISVAATNRANGRANYSSYGARVDIAAPGGERDASGNSTPESAILSTVPTVGVFSDPSGYRAMQGTSMATPYVAGLAALLRSKFPAISAADVRLRLQATAAPVVGANYDEMGGGLVNAALALTASPRPFVAVRKVEVAESAGNGNGIVESGESATLAVDFANAWMDATSATVTLTSSDSRVAITQASATLGAVASGASVRADKFSLTVGNVPQLDTTVSLTFTVNAKGADGKSSSSSANYQLNVGTRELVPARTFFPTVSGRKAAYLEYDGVSVFNVYTSDLITGEHTRITQVPEYNYFQLLTPLSVDITGDLVVYTDSRKGIEDWNVYLHDPARGELVVTDAPGVQYSTGVSGTRVVWLDKTTPTDRVFVRDMADLSNPAVFIHDGTVPRISGNRIAFTVPSDATQKDVYVHDLSTGTTAAVLNDPGDQQVCGISGKLLLYQDADQTLRVLDLESGTRTTITTQTVPNLADASISGTKVVWADSRDGSSDVFLVDLADATHQEIRLTVTRGGHTQPRISGNRVVWSNPSTFAWAELGPELGDVNYNSSVDIVDAMTVSNYYVGNPVPRFFPSAADVNCNGSIDGVDSLLIAQRYIGLIPRFPCQLE